MGMVRVKAQRMFHSRFLSITILPRLGFILYMVSATFIYEVRFKKNATKDWGRGQKQVKSFYSCWIYSKWTKIIKSVGCLGETQVHTKQEYLQI